MKWSLLLVWTLVGVVHIQGDTTTSVKVSENDNVIPDTTTPAVFCRDKEEVCDLLEAVIEKMKEFVNDTRQYINDIIPIAPGGSNYTGIKRKLELMEELENMTRDMEEKKSDLAQGNLKVNDLRLWIFISKWRDQLKRILTELIMILEELLRILLEEQSRLKTAAIETSQDQLTELLACHESTEITATTAGT